MASQRRPLSPIMAPQRTTTSLSGELEILQEENEVLKKEVRKLKKQREQEQSLHIHEMEDLRKLLEGKVTVMLKSKDARNKQLNDSLREYEVELSSFATKCVEMEANVVSMTIENNSLKKNMEVATEMLMEERRMLKMEKEQHQFELDELEALMEDVNTKLRKREEELEEKDNRVKELEALVQSQRNDEEGTTNLNKNDAEADDEKVDEINDIFDEINDMLTIDFSSENSAETTETKDQDSSLNDINDNEKEYCKSESDSLDEITDLTLSRDNLDEHSDDEEEIEYFSLSSSVQAFKDREKYEVDSIGELSDISGLGDNFEEDSEETKDTEDDCKFDGAMNYDKSDYVGINEISGFSGSTDDTANVEDEPPAAGQNDESQNINTYDDNALPTLGKYLDTALENLEPEYFVLNTGACGRNDNFDSEHQKSDETGHNQTDPNPSLENDDEEEDWNFLTQTNFSFLSNTSDGAKHREELTEDDMDDTLTLEDINITDDINDLVPGDKTEQSSIKLESRISEIKKEEKFDAANSGRSSADADPDDKYDLKSLFEEAWMVTLKRRRRFFEELASRDSDE